VTWYASSGHKLRWGTQFENDIEFARELTAFLDAIFDLIIVDADGQAYHYDCPLGEGDWPLHIRLGREILAGQSLTAADMPPADDKLLSPAQIERLDRQFDDWRQRLPRA
jgi:hypothetical protein